LLVSLAPGRSGLFDGVALAGLKIPSDILFDAPKAPNVEFCLPSFGKGVVEKPVPFPGRDLVEEPALTLLLAFPARA
jgi:hypothetical protein